MQSKKPKGENNSDSGSDKSKLKRPLGELSIEDGNLSKKKLKKRMRYPKKCFDVTWKIKYERCGLCANPKVRAVACCCCSCCYSFCFCCCRPYYLIVVVVVALVTVVFLFFVSVAVILIISFVTLSIQPCLLKDIWCVGQLVVILATFHL